MIQQEPPVQVFHTPGEPGSSMLLPAQTLLQQRYLIVRTIAQGGMGVVYQANDQHLGSVVALKQTLVRASGDTSAGADDTSLREALEHEARLLATLRHPALPKVMDYFVNEAGHFLVMEFIPGNDLGTMIEQRGAPFSPGEVLEWGDQLLHVLEYLHRQERPIIHHDIKPQNIKLLEDGQVVLLDFGLARGTVTYQTRVLEHHNLRYTIDYAPIEQIQGTGTSPRSDLYALGATLYHLLSGAPLPPETNALSRAAAPFNDQPDPLPPLHMVNPTIPPALSNLVMRALELRPEARPPSATAMRMALREVRGINLVPSLPREPGADTLATIAADTAAPLPPGVFSIQGMIKRTTSQGFPLCLAFSPEGRLLATGSSDKKIGIGLWEVASGRLIGWLAGHTDSVRSLSFNPNGSMIVSGSEDTTARLWDGISWQEAACLKGHTRRVNAVGFNPLGHMVASASDDATVRLWDVMSGQEIKRFAGHEGPVYGLAFSPDGALLATCGIDRLIRLWDVASGSQVGHIVAHLSPINQLAFSPDGALLASASSDKSLRVWVVKSGQEVGSPRKHKNNVYSVAFHPGGDMLVSGSKDRTIRIWKTESGQELAVLRGHDDSVLQAIFSPNGRLLASVGSDYALHLWGLGLPDAEWAHIEQTWLQQQQRQALRTTGRCEVCGKPLSMWEKIQKKPRCRQHRDYL